MEPVRLSFHTKVSTPPKWFIDAHRSLITALQLHVHHMPTVVIVVSPSLPLPAWAALSGCIIFTDGLILVLTWAKIRGIQRTVTQAGLRTSLTTLMIEYGEVYSIVLRFNALKIRPIVLRRNAILRVCRELHTTQSSTEYYSRAHLLVMVFVISTLFTVNIYALISGSPR